MKRSAPSTKAPASSKPSRARRSRGPAKSAAPWDKLVEMGAGEGSLSLSGGDFAFPPADEAGRTAELN